MGKASSAKKVARAARAGGTRRPGQRRQLGFPALIILVVVAGTSLVLFARSNREANAAPLSQANGDDFDHWHAALGIADCGAFLYDGSPEGGAFFTDFLDDPQGIHTHGDGVIHIHPFLDSAGGRNARMRIFFDDINLQINDDQVTFPDGTVWDEGEKTCTGEDGEDTPGQIVMARWNDAQDAADGERPSEIITEDFGDIRFRNDREYFTLAFVPEGDFDEIAVRPDIISSLNNLSDVPPDENIEAPETTATTTAADAATSTTTGEPSDASTSTTAPGDAGGETTTTLAAG